MLKHSLVAITIIATSIGLSGCGDSSSSYSDTAKHMTQIDKTPVQHMGKFIRELGDDFNGDAIDWEFDNLEGLKIHVDQTDIYLQFTHNSNEPNVQFFLDIDNNSNSGYKNENGADYLVENGYLYKSLEKNSWKWQKVAKVQSHIKDNISDTVKIKLADLENKNIIFKVDARVLNNEWIPTIKSPLDGSKSIYSQKTNIKWEDVAIHGSNGSSVLKVFDTKDMIYVHFEQDQFSDHTQIYIDVDNNKDSGYKSKYWDDFGRDYLIEDSYLYSYNGKGSWGWKFIDFISKQRDDGDKAIIDFSIPKNKLQNISKTIKIGIQTNTKEWTNTKWIPNNSLTLYTLKTDIVDPKDIIINEVMASNTHTKLDPDFYNFSDYIELHNPKDTAIDIGGYNLSDKLNETKWTIPNGTQIPANGYLTIWADDEDTKKTALHTNFKLKSEGEAIALFDRDGKIIDSFEFLKQLSDISIKSENGNIVYMNPTPNATNSQTFTQAIASKKATFSLDSGSYTAAQTLTLSATDEQIHYTTDGSIPTLNSPTYTQAIPINTNMSVRAIASQNGKFVSDVRTNSYLIGENINIPVMFLSIDDKYLHNDTFGIYTIGTNGKTLQNCGDEIGQVSANYMQDWERPAHITMFEDDKKVAFSQQIGVEIAGECSRFYGQKSLKLKANDKYGNEEMKYQIFPDKDIKKFEKLKLRASGQDVYKSHMRDALTNMITKDQLNTNYEAYRPSVLFVNGEYWGIYNIREHMSKEYIKNNYGLKSKKVDFLSGSGSTAISGDNKDYKKLIKFIKDNDLTNQENYNTVASKIDIANYIDYMATNIYIGNTDWPGTNLFYFKEKKNGKKWQWLFHDTDFGFGIYEYLTINGEDVDTSVNFNALEFARTAVNDDRDWPNPDWSTLVFRKLLENSTFKTQFKTRFNTLLDSTFEKERVKGIIDAMAAKIEPQIDKHNAKWEIKDYDENLITKQNWLNEIQELKDYADGRAGIVKTHLEAL